MSGALALATALSTTDRAGLIVLLDSRFVVGIAGVDTPLDLARALLRPESIRRALTLADRDVLLALRTSTGTEDTWGRAAALGLIGRDQGLPTMLPEVQESLERMLAESADPGLQHPAPTDLLTDDSPADSTAWAEHAFALIGGISAMLRQLTEVPARMRANGAVTSGALRDLAGTAGADPEAAAGMIDLARAAGLAGQFTVSDNGPRELRITHRGLRWLTRPRPERWLVLAETLIDRFPETLRAARDRPHTGPQELGWDIAAARVFPWWYPLADQDSLERVRALGALAHNAGLVQHHRLSEPGLAMLAGNPAGALELAESAFPHPIDSFYLQPDLSVIAPGPLRPEIENTLLTFAVGEQVGLASTYRVDAASLETALSRGATANTIREFLAAHSRTGVPQPLDYLLGEVEARHGSIRVGEAPPGSGAAHSVVHTRLPAQLATLLVDSGLRHLGLERVDETRALSRFRPEQLRAALREARIPVSPAAGHETAPPEPAPADQGDHAQDPNRSAALADRLLASAQGDTASGGIERALQLAVRDRTRVRITVAAAGQERDFLLLPTALGNGRLRGVDTAAEVERTLPLAQITQLRTLPDRT